MFFAMNGIECHLFYGSDVEYAETGSHWEQKQKIDWNISVTSPPPARGTPVRSPKLQKREIWMKNEEGGDKWI